MKSEEQVLVTGAGGFIGKALLKKLLNAGYKCIAVVRQARQAEELRLLGAEVILSDLIEVANYRAELLSSHFVFHLGGNATFGNIGDYEQSNIGVTKKIVEILSTSQVLRRLVFTSTIGAVDRDKTDPCVSYLNSHSEPHPTSTYGKSKLECEGIILGSKLPYAIFRPSWVYGPGMRNDSHLYVFLRACIEDKSLSKLGFPGKISAIYIDDMVDVLISSMGASSDVNIHDFVDDGVQRSFYDIFEIGRKLANRSGPFRIPAFIPGILRPFVSLIPFKVKCLLFPALACENSLSTVLSWKPKIDFQVGMENTYKYIMDRPRGLWLVTGAASGIGKAYVDLLDKRGYSILLVDRNEGVESFARQIGQQSLIVDLGSEGAVEKISEYLRANNIFIEGLVNCAGFGVRGSVSSYELSDIDAMIKVNLTVPVQLCRLVVSDMLSNGIGTIINVSSSVAEAPLPGMALYAATKAGIYSFSNALWGELRGTPIKVLTVSPSGTKTSFQNVAGVKVLNDGKGLMSADDVARETFLALEKSKSNILLGWKSKILLLITRCLPMPIRVIVWGKMMESSR